MKTIQATKEPMNAKILDPMRSIEKEGLLPVTTYMIHEPSTNSFHPDGLFSEIIFGNIGSTDRLVRFGYIDLKVKVFNPTTYTNLLKLSGFYSSILEGKAYAIFNKKLKNFEVVDSSTDGARTGFGFFTEYVHQIDFAATGSLIRDDRIAVLDKYSDILLFNKLLVLPAGARDIKEDERGRVSMEDINKIYLSILSLASSLPDDTEVLSDPVFDPVKYAIQTKIMEIYDYILKDIVGGKNGYALGSFGARNVALGTRNVITAAPITNVKSPLDPDYFRNDESLLPLFQCMKSSMPLIQFMLKNRFLDRIFGDASGDIPLINPHTYDLEYMSIDEDTRSLYTTAEGLEKLINKFDNPYTVFQPFSIPVIGSKFKYGWCFLVYDLEDKVYIFRDIHEFKSSYSRPDRWSLQPLLTDKDITDLSVLDGIKYCIGYGVAIEVYGYKDIVSDTIDILVDNTSFNKLKDRSEVTYSRDLPYLILGNILIHNTDNFDTIYKSSTEIDGYKVVNISQLRYMYSQIAHMDSKYRFRYNWLDLHVVDMSKVRPMTNVECFYLTTYLATHDKYNTFTRYPVLQEYGILNTKLAIQSTEPSRVVTYGSVNTEDDTNNLVLPRYPVIENSKLKGSMAPHPATLSGYDRRVVSPF